MFENVAFEFLMALDRIESLQRALGAFPNSPWLEEELDQAVAELQDRTCELVCAGEWGNFSQDPEPDPCSEEGRKWWPELDVLLA